MTRIGSFTRDGDGYAGRIHTLWLDLEARFTVATKVTGAEGPNYRLLAGDVEIGVAWKQLRRDGLAYLAVKLDDPCFAAPIYATLVEDGGALSLIWSR